MRNVVKFGFHDIAQVVPHNMRKPFPMRYFVIFIVLFFWFSTLSFAQEVQEVQEGEESQVPIFPVYQTLGGIFFWQDTYFYHEWRIQYNIRSGAHRLLDPHCVCCAVGTYDDCLQRLDELKIERAIPPMKGRVLVLLHGFGSNRLTLQRMAGWFRTRKTYSAVVNITYPSTSVSVQEEARLIHRIVTQMEGVESIDMVGHSLGALILRCYLGNPPDGERGELPDPRIRRFVQLCPPNAGLRYAQDALSCETSGFFQLRPLRDLSLSREEMLEQFGTPACEFAIIAGGRGDENGFSNIIPGDDDWVVPVQNTRLDGAKDFLLLHGEHGEIPNMIETFLHVERFLNEGAFCTGT
ncbi:MAG: hypothetical protein Q4D38_08815 [Planctomycetia bacterium]|nr:hypothetical protein [Planctomycetia bacterium]